MYVVIQRFIIFICKICICIFTQTYPIYSFLTDLDFKPLNSFLKYIHDISIYIYTHKNTHVCCHIKIYYIYMQNMYLYIHLDLSHLLFPDRPRLQTLKYFPQIYSRYLCENEYIQRHTRSHTSTHMHVVVQIFIIFIYKYVFVYSHKLITLKILSQIDKLSSFQIQKVLLDQLRFCRILIAHKKQITIYQTRRKKRQHENNSFKIIHLQLARTAKVTLNLNLNIVSNSATQSYSQSTFQQQIILLQVHNKQQIISYKQHIHFINYILFFNMYCLKQQQQYLQYDTQY
eukprot:TRINITY_DN8668_c0_g1_i5.p1 TRINITY_DN8668_c0_g1~~TRINITY_DN8668_c0_g1_i5.p1  ORF type:complete len:287 (-),score=-34.11 TRINITY_DN8668_c0_g1_i5:803-1663(-)